MKRLILSLVIFALVISAVCVNTLKVFRICDDLYMLLENKKIKTAYDTWKESTEYLLFFVNRRMIENMDSEAESMINYYRTGNIDQSNEARTRFMYKISELREFEKPTSSNIFSVDIFA